MKLTLRFKFLTNNIDKVGGGQNGCPGGAKLKAKKLNISSQHRLIKNIGCSVHSHATYRFHHWYISLLPTLYRDLYFGLGGGGGWQVPLPLAAPSQHRCQGLSSGLAPPRGRFLQRPGPRCLAPCNHYLTQPAKKTRKYLVSYHDEII